MALLAVGAAVALSVFVRLRIADVPFERDEGEYAYAGQLILQGMPPYRLVYNMKFPGTYYAYAGILTVFGETTRGVHLGLMAVNAVTTLFLWLLGRRLLGELGGVAAAWAWIALSLDRWVMGVFAHATHFVALPVVAALWLLLVASERRKAGCFVASGALLGVAVLMKQHAAIFVLLGTALAFWLAWREEPNGLRAGWRRAAGVLAGALVPLAIMATVLAAHGVFGRFWFWTVDYALAYATELPLASAPARLLAGLGRVTQATMAFWVAAGIGLIALWVDRWSGRARAIVTSLLVASLLATSPGFFYREHYFIVMLPAVALLVGVAVVSLQHLVSRALPAAAARAVTMAALALLVASYAFSERAYLFSMPPLELSRSRYGTNPFVESPTVAAYLRAHTSDDDRIAVLGSEPQIYFLAGRRSATGYIYTYPMMESQPFARHMQEEMRHEIEAAHPTYLVFAQVGASWLARPLSDQWILRWGMRFARDCYDLVGVADIATRGGTRYVWEQEALGYRPTSASVLYVFRRKSAAPCVARAEAVTG